MPFIPVINQIKAIETAGKAEFRRIESVANFAAARDDLKNPPAAYVLPLQDAASANQLGGGAILQPVKEHFGVVLAVSNLRDASGVAALIEFRRLRRLVIDNLLGFVPGTDYEPIEYVGGNILLMDAAVLWWQLKFTTGYMERNF